MSTSAIVRKIIQDKTGLFKATGMFPGKFDGKNRTDLPPQSHLNIHLSKLKVHARPHLFRVTLDYSTAGELVQLMGRINSVPVCKIYQHGGSKIYQHGGSTAAVREKEKEV